MGITDFLKSLLQDPPEVSQNSQGSQAADPILYPEGSPRLSSEQIQAYDRWLLPLEDRLVAELEKLTWLKIYARMPIEQRQEVMQRVVDTYASIFGFRQAQVLVNTNKRPISWFGQGTILLDTRMIASLDLAASTVLHEGTHNHQRSVVNRFKRGELAPEDPLAAMAEVWEYNFRNYLSPQPGKIALYERQPVEFFANRFALCVLSRVSYLR